MITFANPAWLYGLLGLLVPIGIHLLSRKEGKIIYIGSIRHLTDSDTAQFSSIKLNEILLLILRLIFFTLLVFILAGFRIDYSNRETKRWVVIEKGIERNKNYKSLVDSIKAKGFEIHWLADELPKFEDSSHVVVEPTNYYNLIQQIEAEADTAVVLSYGYANRFRGEKTSIPSSVKWLTVEPHEKQLTVLASDLPEDSVLVRKLKSSPMGTSFQYDRLTRIDFENVKKIDSLKIEKAETINITIFSDPQFDYDQKIIHAAIQAIASRIPLKFNISFSNKSSEIADTSAFVFWLSGEPSRLKEATVFGYTKCSNANYPLLISREKSQNSCASPESYDWILTKRLNEENALEEALAFSLAKILLKGVPIYKNQNVTSSDQRSLPVEAAFGDGNEIDSPVVVSENHAGNEPALMVLLFLVLIAERYIAYKRNQ